MEHDDIKDTIQNLFDDEGLREILLNIEEYFDNMDLYVFKNWITGEIVEGPNVSKYWVDLTLKYPMDKMPDPRGALLFESQGTIVEYKFDTEDVPVKIPFDYTDLDTTTMRHKIEEVPVILIKFKIPRKLVDQSEILEYDVLDNEEDSSANQQDTPAAPVDDSPQDVPDENQPM